MFTRIMKLKTNNILAFIALVSFSVLGGCQKSKDEPAAKANASVLVNLSVGEPTEEKVTFAGNRSARKNVQNIQRSNVYLDGGMTLEVSVTDQGKTINSSTSNASATGSPKAEGASILRALAYGTMYRVVVYDASNNYVTSQDYQYGITPPSTSIAVQAGATYTFIVYSINSTESIPDIDGRENLSTAKLSNISADLMFFKRTMEIQLGMNNLDAVLQHQFSQITTSFEMDDTMTGVIESISEAAFNPTKVNGTLNFADGTLEFPTENASANIVYSLSAFGGRTITSEPTFIISPTTISSNLTIASMVIDSETKTNISIPNIKITPGHRYNMKIKIRSCLQEVTSAPLDWNYPETSWISGRQTLYGIYKTDERRYYQNGETITNTFTAPEANYGFQFDIRELDNAFNMKVNGKYIYRSAATDQIQFETFSTTEGQFTNIEFQDGSQYGDQVDMIYLLRGTNANPIIRIVISKTGEVQMFGSKVSNGPLFPLRLKGDRTFNKVDWNKTGSNTVEVSQTVAGATVIIGRGYGRKTVRCN